MPITLSAIAGHNSPVQLSTSGLPSGITATFMPASVTGAGTSVLTLTASVSALPGKYSFRVEGAAGLVVRSTMVTLTPAPEGGIEVTLSSSNLAVAALNLATLYIPGGQSSSSRARISGLSAGSSAITALAGGYAPARGLIQVGSSPGTMSFAPSALSLVAPGTQNLTLSLSPPAPAAGVIVTLGSSNPIAASVPSTISVAANAALSNGYAPATVQVQVGGQAGMMSFTPSALSLVPGQCPKMNTHA